MPFYGNSGNFLSESLPSSSETCIILPMKSTKVLSAQVPSTLYQDLAQLAERNHRSLSGEVRYALLRHIGDFVAVDPEREEDGASQHTD